jgi:hypothetical protein
MPQNGVAVLNGILTYTIAFLQVEIFISNGALSAGKILSSYPSSYWQPAYAL